MPVRYRIDKGLRIVFSTGSGKLTEEELLDHQRRLPDDPDFDAGFWQLYNYGDADVSEISAECVQALTRSTLFAERTRRAVVVGDHLAPSVAAAFEAFCARSGSNVRVFRELEPALTWLELD